MRIAADTQLLEARPGDTATLALDVVNTGGVIDGVTARVIGLPEHSVHAEPSLLSLFPDASGRLTLSLDVPSTQPAGRHPLTVEVVSHGARFPSQFVDLDLDVSARPAMTFASRPRVVRARREGRFVLELDNTGNVALAVRLEATDVDRVVSTTFAPTELRLEPGAVAPVLLTVRGPRMVVGAELDRVVTVRSTAGRVAVPGTVSTTDPLDLPPAVPVHDDLQLETTVRLRQRPLLSRGLLTALILVGIVALWAAIFLFGLTRVFAGDPLTKTAPASFFASSPVGADGQPVASGAPAAPGAAGGVGKTAGVPAGALAKNGQLPPGIGGNISGTVTAASNGKGVGRVIVEARRSTPTGLQVVSRAATQSDGTYTIAGLFPTTYLVRFSSTGYPTRWWPVGTSAATAKPVVATAQSTTTGVDLVVTGKPASISGTVDPGDTPGAVVTTVTARALDAISGVSPVTTKTVKNAYRLTGLQAPGTYELSFVAKGYRATTMVDTVAGGQARLEPEVQLAVGLGQITGRVTDQGAPLGGATVSTTVGGKPLSVTTPTSGSVGTFLLGNLPTPATYVIAVAKPGYGTHTSVIDLAAGASRSGLTVELSSGTGSVSGVLVDGSGQGLGGATVTVGGTLDSSGTAATPSAGASAAPTAGLVPSTTTLTRGVVGQFVVNGLTAPGSYTLTFSLEGYAPVTVPVDLLESGPSTVRPVMTTQLGQVSGKVTDKSGGNFVGATITVTDGHQSWTTTSTSTGPGADLAEGGFLVDGLVPGSYAVTASADAKRPQTALITVTAGKTTRADLRLGG